MITKKRYGDEITAAQGEEKSEIGELEKNSCGTFRLLISQFLGELMLNILPSSTFSLFLFF